MAYNPETVWLSFTDGSCLLFYIQIKCLDELEQHQGHMDYEVVVHRGQTINEEYHINFFAK